MVRTALVVMLLSLGSAAPAEAQQIYQVRFDQDAPVIAASLAVGATPQLFTYELPAARCLPRCNRLWVNPIERWVIGLHSMFADVLSDVLVIAIPIAGLALDLTDTRDRAFWQDATVVLEAYALQALVLSLTKFGVRRPRPYVYDDTLPPQERTGRESTLSFFSGHTSIAFVTAVAFAETYRRRHDGTSVALVYASGLTLATLVGACRILAGKHFLTDVLVGALVGTSFGILIPALHARSRE
jgi:membrane-associated phospholipid phosphatase